MKKEEGITLVTEVIIIVILFILIGVGISLVARENPVLSQVKVAVASDRKTQVKEEIRVGYKNAQDMYWTEYDNNPKIIKENFFVEDNILQNEIYKITGNKTEIKVTKDENEFIVNYKNTNDNEKFNFKIDENGNIINIKNK